MIKYAAMYDNKRLCNETKPYNMNYQYMANYDVV